LLSGDKKSRTGPLYHLSHGQREPDGLSASLLFSKWRTNDELGLLAAASNRRTFNIRRKLCDRLRRSDPHEPSCAAAGPLGIRAAGA
jgi:hypothetical protein